MGMKLMLCSRTLKREGWKTLDACSTHGPDIVALIPPLPAEVTSVQWDEVELVHGITSFYFWEARQLVKEIKTVLAPGGKLVFEQPDFNQAKAHVEWLFGDPTLCDPLHMNRWAYTPKTLRTVVEEAGFEHIAILPALYHDSGRDFRLEAW